MTHRQALRSLAFILVALVSGCSDAPPGSSAAPPSTSSSVGETTEIELVAVTPGRGIYAEPLDILIEHPSAARVRYTLDGSDPRGPSALNGSLPLTLRIDPANTEHRYLAPGVILRLTTEGAAGPAASVVTHSYLFIEQVLALSPDGTSPGGTWPVQGEAPGTLRHESQAIDYGLDPDITQDPEYGPALLGALKALPSLSLVTDPAHLFDADTGIYVNAQGRGRAWERFGSMEIVSPGSSSPAVQANLGMRIRGGVSRSGSNPKHGFRLFFRGEYGLSRLNYPLFGDEGVASFDKLDLRTTQNYSWHRDSGDEGAECTMNRDVFTRDLQRALGRPYTRSRYYHLYLNGVYWGIFQSEERPDANFAASYLGGTSGEYDVIKVATDQGNTLEASDGNLEGWRRVWRACQTGFARDVDYYRLEGKNASGQRDPTLDVLVDIDNLVDYMMIVFYTANFDAPVSKWQGNKSPNNFFAIFSRARSDQGVVFIAHDNEHTLFSSPVNITSGLSEDRVNIGAVGGAKDSAGHVDPNLQMSVTAFERFHPQWLHQRLTESALYRARFAARAHQLLDSAGPLTTGPTQALFGARALELDQAIIAESARWGDFREDVARTKRDDWAPAVARVRDVFLVARTSVVIAQLAAAGLY